MSPLKFTLFFSMLTFILLLQTAFGAEPIFQICSTSSNFTADDPYELNLKRLMGYLSYTTPASGFCFGSMGDGNYQPYGLALCRGDVLDVQCATCVTEASSQVRDYCLYNKDAITWFDNCLVKYSDKNFFGQIDFQNVAYAWNLQNATDPTSFNINARKLLLNLSKQASKRPTMFATGSLEVEGSEKIYGLAQCTGDLSGHDCKKCIKYAIKRLPDCCDGKRGGRVMSGSCYIRYEVFPFFIAKK